MDYEEWISRERKIRIKILKDSPIIKKKGTFRVCICCREVCLCHERNCPNCNSSNIMQWQINDIDAEMYDRIRCRFRFEHLT